MTEITLPVDLALALTAANEPVRLVDVQGNVIGIAARTTAHQNFMEADFSEALRRSKSPVHGRALTEVLAQLEAMDQQ